jgi:HAE1 family hydrophobic/amphiphilic exporter-1
VVQFSGDIANAVTVKSLGKIVDSAEDAKTIGLLYYPYRTVPIEKPGLIARITGATTKDVPITDAKVRPALFLDVFKQSGSNTVAVADGIKEKVKKINESLKNTEGSPRLEIMSDYSKSIKDNVDDVTVTIIFGIILAVITVYMFLGNIRSTIITGIAIPTSLFGAFILMYVAGFTINLMSLMALSLAVGLLIDDAIVIQENIYRKREAKMHPFEAAEFGTEEVKLAVIATTLVVISVFMPISFLSGSIGAFFKPFGFSVVFAMAISLLAALTIAPLLNAYFGGTGHKNNNLLVRGFDRLQDKVDGAYEKIITFTLANPVKILVATALIFVSSLVMVFFVPKTFQPENDSGQFNLNIELAAGTSLEGTRAVTDQIIPKLQKIKEIKYFSLVIGNQRGETNKATFGIMCVPRSERKVDTNGLKQLVRKQITEFKFANPSVTNAFGGGGGGKPFSLNISGDNLDELDEYSKRVIDILQKVPAFRKKTPAFTEISSNYKPGTPEFQVKLDPMKMEMIGVQPRSVGNELRTYIAGTAVAKLHENGLQYDIRVRLNPYQRNLRTNYPFIRVPNTQNKMIPLNAISTTKEVIGPSLIMRQDRARIIQVSANLVPGEAIGNAGAAAMQLISKEPKPKGVSIKLVGQSEDYADLMKSFAIAFGLSILFIFLVLASLYDSFITPATILMALPPALTGAFAALFFTGRMFDMFSLIGIITLLGLVTKNSILLVDFALEGIRAGMSQKEAIKRAGLVRLRPILMTSFAIIAGMLPLALGVGEAAAYRKSMGVAIIGGVIFSTFLTLLVVPAIFEFIDRFRAFIERLFLSDEIICATKEISCGDSKELVGDIPSHAEQVAKKAANGVKGKNKSKPKRPSK